MVCLLKYLVGKTEEIALSFQNLLSDLNFLIASDLTSFKASQTDHVLKELFPLLFMERQTKMLDFTSFILIW